MAVVVTVNDVLDGHVGLDMECLDRIYLNGYVPNLQVGGQVVSFMTAHLGNPIPSPAIMEKIGTAFRTAVQRFAADNQIPVVRFGKDDRKVDVMRPYLARQARPAGRGGRDRDRAGVPERVRLGATHGPQRGSVVFVCHGRPAGDVFLLLRVGRPFRVGVHQDAPTSRTRSRCGSTATNGPNAKPPRRALGSANCPTGSPPALTRPRCRRSAIGWARPHRGVLRMLDEPVAAPLTEDDLDAGYWWELSMRQIEVSRTLVFTPRATPAASSRR